MHGKYGLWSAPGYRGLNWHSSSFCFELSPARSFGADATLGRLYCLHVSHWDIRQGAQLGSCEHLLVRPRLMATGSLGLATGLGAMQLQRPASSAASPRGRRCLESASSLILAFCTSHCWPPAPAAPVRPGVLETSLRAWGVSEAAGLAEDSCVASLYACVRTRSRLHVPGLSAGERPPGAFCPWCPPETAWSAALSGKCCTDRTPCVPAGPLCSSWGATERAWLEVL